MTPGKSKSIPIPEAPEFKLRYREVTVSILEVVPPTDQLPYCTKEKRDGNLCDFHARYTRDGKAVCGVHLFSKGDIFLED